MSSWPIWMIFDLECSAWCAQQCILYIRLDRTLLPEPLASWNTQNQQKKRGAMKDLHNFMSSCPIRIIFDLERSAWYALPFIPHIRLDRTAPSSSVGQLKSLNQKKPCTLGLRNENLPPQLNPQPKCFWLFLDDLLTSLNYNIHS